MEEGDSRLLTAAPSWFMLGLASGFLVTAAMSFAFNGLFGFYYLLIGGACAVASFVTAMVGSRVREPQGSGGSRGP